ncbi:MAG: helix-turn-helix domain-containing protein [Candidatus Altiarchaeota archaeon]|nr:helix-turn-helix domain-containing protein [Candidatus Altiarchaeota archaeon]
MEYILHIIIIYVYRLTEREKLVLYFLVKWPNLNDIELSRRIPVKRPTITAIRNKLRRDGLFYNVVVPNIPALGCELLVLRYGAFNPAFPYDARKKYSATAKFPEVFFKQSCDSQQVSLSAHSNFTDAMRYVEYSSINYNKHDLLTPDGLRHVFLPLAISKVLRFFEFAPLLKQEFEIRAHDGKYEEKQVQDNVVPRALTGNEKLVLYALVKYPEDNDGEIARKVSMTRQSVNKLRKKLEEDRLIARIRIPDMKRFGYEVMVMAHFFNNPKHPLEERKEGLKYTLAIGNIVFMVVSNLESVIVGYQKSFTSYKREMNHFMEYYKKSDFVGKEPEIVIIPVEEIKESMNGRYHPLVKKMLGIEQEI